MPRLGKFVFSFGLFVLVCYGGLVWFVNNEVEKGFNEAVVGVDGLTVTYDDIWVSLTDRTVTLAGVVATFPDGQKASADSLIVHAFDERNPVPHFIKAQVKGIQYALPRLGDGLAKPAGIIDGQDLSGDVWLDYQYDKATRTLTLNTFTFDDHRLGTVNLSGVLSDLDLDLDHFRMEKLIGLRLDGAELIFRDKSLIQQLMEQTAQAMSVSEVQARARVCAELTAMADYAESDGNPVAEKVLRGVKRFVDNPGILTLSARPEEPVPCIYFFMGRDVYDILRLMNVSAETEPKAKS